MTTMGSIVRSAGTTLAGCNMSLALKNVIQLISKESQRGPVPLLDWLEEGFLCMSHFSSSRRRMPKNLRDPGSVG